MFLFRIIQVLFSFALVSGAALPFQRCRRRPTKQLITPNYLSVKVADPLSSVSTESPPSSKPLTGPSSQLSISTAPKKSEIKSASTPAINPEILSALASTNPGMASSLAFNKAATMSALTASNPAATSVSIPSSTTPNPGKNDIMDRYQQYFTKIIKAGTMLGASFAKTGLPKNFTTLMSQLTTEIQKIPQIASDFAKGAQANLDEMNAMLDRVVDIVMLLTSDVQAQNAYKEAVNEGKLVMKDLIKDMNNKGMI